MGCDCWSWWIVEVFSVAMHPIQLNEEDVKLISLNDKLIDLYTSLLLQVKV